MSVFVFLYYIFYFISSLALKKYGLNNNKKSICLHVKNLREAAAEAAEFKAAAEYNTKKTKKCNKKLKERKFCKLNKLEMKILIIFKEN